MLIDAMISPELKYLSYKDALQVKVANHDIYQPGFTMEEIIDEAVEGQLTKNAVLLLKNNSQRRVTGHVILSVGCTHLLCKTRFFECNKNGTVVYRDSQPEQWRKLQISVL